MMRLNRRSRAAAYLAIVTASAGLAATATLGRQAPAAAQAQPAAQGDSLTTLNVASRAFYAGAKTAATARLGPVVIAMGDNLILRNAGKREEVRAIPPTYHSLKALAHIPLALDVALSVRPGNEPFDEAFLEQLRHYRALVTQAEKTLGDFQLNPEQIERQRTIIADCLKLIDSVLGGHRPAPGERIAFARSMNPHVLNNTAEAVRAQLDGYHRQMTAWKAQMSPDEWNRLTVVVAGMHLPRNNNTAVQYFAKLLGETGESQRIVYSESVFDETRQLDLLATCAVDTLIGIDFFNDPLRMHRDLLGDAAGLYIPLIVDGRH